MERDLSAEIDRISEELDQLKKMWLRGSLPKTKPAQPEGGKEVLSPAGQETLDRLRDELVQFTGETGETGAVAYTGNFSANDRHSIWAMSVQTDFLLNLNDQHMAEKVLASVGNGQRLALLLALLKQPMSVAQLVEATGSNSTGQIYHHIKPLVLADIIYEEKGIYAVKPHRVQGLIMLLAGVWDLTDPRYTHGSWEESGEK
jgi:DNA gyrase subunit B